MKNRRRPALAAALSIAATLVAGGTVLADEGMWTFNNLPLKALKEHHGFTPPPGWADHLRGAAVRFNNGGSGSFVSADGLIMTNHHVGADTLQKISDKEHDYYKVGFLAKSHAEEVKAPDLELNVLTGIRDVTEAVNAGISKATPDAEAEVARRKAIASIEKASQDETGLKAEVVKLYQGGQYHLYNYKAYTDVRLVFAPEFDIAFFGGDPDNFEYPRYDLDVCFFRAYEGGRPAKVKDHLAWSAAGAKPGDLVFVAGHPGRTNRLNTVSHLEYLRDTAYPVQLAYLMDTEAFLGEYGRRGPEQARQAKEDLFGIQNSRKARIGGLGGLTDRAFMHAKAQAEATLRAKVDADPRKKAAYGAAWEKLAAAHQHAAEGLWPYNFVERGLGINSELFRFARTLVRMAEEDQKPNAERLREFRDSARQSLDLALFSDAPIYPEYEEAKVAHSLAYWQSKFPDDAILARVLHGRTPAEAAKALVGGTKLGDVAARKALAAGGTRAVAESTDPMIKLALAIDADGRAMRKVREDKLEGVESSQYALIARALFEVQGDTVYPDATFTLRLAYGTVKGYEVDGKSYPPFTEMGGAFGHAATHGDQPPYQLPPSWIEAKKDGRLKLDTPFNFVSTADIIGGNSGSPVVDKDNKVVGLIFDGNIQSLVLDFGFDDKVARAVSVDSRAIVEALRSIYKADGLVEELTGSK